MQINLEQLNNDGSIANPRSGWCQQSAQLQSIPEHQRYIPSNQQLNPTLNLHTSSNTQNAYNMENSTLNYTPQTNSVPQYYSSPNIASSNNHSVPLPGTYTKRSNDFESSAELPQ